MQINTGKGIEINLLTQIDDFLLIVLHIFFNILVHTHTRVYLFQHLAIFTTFMIFRHPCLPPVQLLPHVFFKLIHFAT